MSSHTDKKEEFRKYLEKHSVLSVLTTVLTDLFEMDTKPSDPLAYLHERFGERVAAKNPAPVTEVPVAKAEAPEAAAMEVSDAAAPQQTVEVEEKKKDEEVEGKKMEEEKKDEKVEEKKELENGEKEVEMKGVEKPAEQVLTETEGKKEEEEKAKEPAPAPATDGMVV